MTEQNSIFTWPCGCISPAEGGEVTIPCAECASDDFDDPRAAAAARIAEWNAYVERCAEEEAQDEEQDADPEDPDLYSPSAWSVNADGAGGWEAWHRGRCILYRARRSGEFGGLIVESPAGQVYNVNLPAGTCSCPHGTARPGKPDKHLHGIATAVAAFCDMVRRQRASLALDTPADRARFAAAQRAVAGLGVRRVLVG